jgi:hypothetical protein
VTTILPRERPMPEHLTELGDYAALAVEGKFEKEKTGMDSSKWVLNSLTMWGAFITAVSASLPSLNVFMTYFFDWSIEPGWVEGINDGVKNLIMGVGSIVGIVMVVYGRWVATAPLKMLPK